MKKLTNPEKKYFLRGKNTTTMIDKKFKPICLIAVCGNRYNSLHIQWNRYKNVKNEQSTPEKKKIFVIVPMWPRPTNNSMQQNLRPLVEDESFKTLHLEEKFCH